MIRRALVLVALGWLAGVGRGEVEIAYQVTVADPATRQFHVRCEVRGLEGTTVDLALPTYAIGNHQLRPYFRHVQQFRDAAGQAVSRHGAFWTVAVREGRAGAEYNVEAYETEVSRGFVQAFLSPEGGYFLGPAVLMYPQGHTQSPCRLSLELPAGWKVGTALQPAEGSDRVFTAPSYPELLDGPVEVGLFRQEEVKASGHPIRFVLAGRADLPDEALLQPARRIAEAELDLFGWAPFEDYTYLTHFGRFLGGLEHRSCCTMNLSAGGRDLEVPTLIMAHELFHAWNGRAVCPEGWGDDRDQQVLPDGDYLWLYEGITVYYTAVFLGRSGLRTPEQFCREAGDHLQRALNDLHGPGAMSLSQLSVDSLRSSLQLEQHVFTLYARGFLAGLLLDLQIRQETKNRRSLDDLMRLMVEKYGKTGKCYGPDAFRQALDEATGLELDGLYERLIHSTEEPSLESLAWGGLSLERREAWDATLGVYTVSPESTHVVAVSPQSAAARAGIAAGDTILQVGDIRVARRQEIENAYAGQVGDRAEGVAVTVRRGGAEVRVMVQPGKRVVCHVRVSEGKPEPPMLRVRRRLDVQGLFPLWSEAQ